MAVDKQFMYILLLMVMDWRQLALSAAAEFSRLQTRSTRRVLPSSQQDADGSDACVQSFQLSENTIIRTQDSRNLGAKYLNETELPTKEACMQWCCDTNECNVAVYEEKNKGSCYIFDCSPAGDFKCKFTSHNHYSVAVLKIARHSYDLGKWGSESKHEEELKYLRMTSLSNMTPTSPLTTTSTTTTTTTVATEAPMVPVVPSVASPPAKAAANVQPATENAHRCSRFQFECRNTSECIAIYNACDGIPQCSDGSDESEELDCPTAKSHKTKQPSGGGSVSHSLKQTPVSGPSGHHLDNDHPFVNSEPVLDSDGQLDPPASLPYLGQPRPDFIHQQLQEQHPRQQQQQQQPQNQYYKTKAARPDAHPAGSIFNHKGNGLLQNQQYNNQNSVPYHRPALPHGAYSDQYEPPSQDDDGVPAYSHSQQQHPLAAPHNYPNPDYEGGSDYWQPEAAREKQSESFSAYDHSRMPVNQHKSAHEGSMSQSYSHGQPQNHGSLTNSHGRPQSSPPEHYDDRNTFPTRTGYNYHENYQMDPLNLPQTKGDENTYSDDMGQATGNGQSLPDVSPYRMEAKAAKKTLAAEKSLSFVESKAGIPGDVKSQASSLETKDPQTSNVIPNEVGVDGELSSAPETAIKLDTIPTEVPIIATVKQTEASIHSHAQLHKVEVNLAQVAVQDIDESNESSGAVLALTLGLSITGLLLVLVGCRLRVVRRHLRRGRSPYAHDADYLVNGMYL